MTPIREALAACTGGDSDATTIARVAGVGVATAYRWLRDGSVKDTKHVRALLAELDKHSPGVSWRAEIAAALCGVSPAVASPRPAHHTPERTCGT
jgi:hypothetical protein